MELLPLEHRIVWEPAGTARLEGVAPRARRASDLRGYFEDASALEAIIRAGDPVVYETYTAPVPESRGHLVYGLTVLYPGRVGREYYLTKGHFHEVRETAEVYHGLQGQGYLVMESESGAARAVAMGPGSTVYVPPGWAHRSVNTGSTPFVLFWVFPGEAGHDYGTVQRSGFRLRVVEEAGEPRVVVAVP